MRQSLYVYDDTKSSLNSFCLFLGTLLNAMGTSRSLLFIDGISFSRRDDRFHCCQVPAIQSYLLGVVICNYLGEWLSNPAMGVEFGHLVRFGVPPHKDQYTSGPTNLFVQTSGQTQSRPLESLNYVDRHYVFDFETPSNRLGLFGLFPHFGCLVLCFFYSVGCLDRIIRTNTRCDYG